MFGKLNYNLVIKLNKPLREQMRKCLTEDLSKKLSTDIWSLVYINVAQELRNGLNSKLQKKND